MRFIGKPEWFTYRMAGWGLDVRTWQGWVYVGVVTALLVAFGFAPIPQKVQYVLIGSVAGVFLMDVFIIMVQLGKVHDERERHHQLIIERNCSYAAVIALSAAMGYQIFQNRHRAGSDLPFDPWLMAVILIMAFTKLGSTIYLRWKR